MEEKLSFDQIALTPSEQKLLKRISKKFLADHTGNKDVEALVANGLAKKTIIVTWGHSYLNALAIEERGKRYLAYLIRENKANRIEAVRFFWTTLIAVLALLIATAALVIDIWQLWISKLPQG